MDSRPETLAEEVRGKRIAIDNDLELLRVRLQKVDPRRIDSARLAEPRDRLSPASAPPGGGRGAAVRSGRCSSCS